MKRFSIPDQETFIAAIQNEISRTAEGRKKKFDPSRRKEIRRKSNRAKT